MHKFWLGLGSLAFASWAMAAAPQETKVSITEGTQIYFKGDDNRREQFVDVSLPESVEAFGSVALHLKLSCPDGRCDWWDRVGSFGIMQGDNKQYLEMMRFITPFRIGADWTYDLSDFLPLLQGQKTFRFFIDTWVGPGSPYGNGWMIAADLTYGPKVAGQPVAAHVQPILSFEDVVYGNPAVSSERTAQLDPLLGYQSAQLHMIITGHGQGNAENCGEFCAKTHTVRIGTRSYERKIWRDDCATTGDPNQKGSWMYPRAGWCPGDKVTAWRADISTALLEASNPFSYQPETFENTCRPGVVECLGCVFDTSCDYDGGMHTEPRYYVSAYVIYYR